MTALHSEEAAASEKLDSMREAHAEEKLAEHLATTSEWQAMLAASEELTRATKLNGAVELEAAQLQLQEQKLATKLADEQLRKAWAESVAATSTEWAGKLADAEREREKQQELMTTEQATATKTLSTSISAAIAEVRPACLCLAPMGIRIQPARCSKGRRGSYRNLGSGYVLWGLDGGRRRRGRRTCSRAPSSRRPRWPRSSTAWRRAGGRRRQR